MKTIKLDHITKIEGHAKLTLGVDNGKVQVCELSSMEGSRYFEGLVVGRQYFEAHEMTSRICGICSCAHVVASITAIEDAIGYKPTEQTKQLRLLMMLGERIRSHATHLYFLALPDYLGYESALAMAPDHKPELRMALQLMRTGNAIIKMLGARDLHPVSAAVGGWLALPSQEELGKLKQELIAAKVTADNTCEIFFDLGYPDFKTEGNYFSLAHTKVFPVLEGSFCMTNRCRDRHEYKEFIEEHHEKHSSANFVVKEGKRYFTGALARINNNKDNLSDDAKKMLSQSAITFPSKNPYHNNIAQAIEMVHCIDEAIRICDRKIKNEKFKRPEPKAGTGIAAIEVPRGTLWHEYELDGAGKILNANIITPTSQNLLNMQEDIRQIVPMLLDKKKEDVVLEIEKLIRSYDPCFSCSAHFLEVKWV